MLNLLRRGVKTWVAKVLFGLLVVSFAIWGIGDVFSSGLGSSVATIGDQKIPAERYGNALNREVRAASQRFGQPLDGEMVRALGLPQQVLARLAQEATMDQTMEELQVSAPDDAVRKAIISDPGFAGQGGAFDEQNYRYVLAQNGYDPESYENEICRTLARRQLIIALSDDAAAPAGAIDALYEFQTELRRFDHITLTEDMAGEIGEPDEAALKTWHEENAAEFTEPERRDATYLHLSLDALSQGFEPDEDALNDLYERHRADYARPERRTLFQVVFDKEEEAEAAAARIASGEADFDAILTERNESRNDVALGEVTKDDLLPAVSDAVFALTAPGVAGPVNTGFGFALIDVSEIKAADTTPMEDVKAQLSAELKREFALDQAPEIAGEVEDRRAAGATLEEIAKEMGLTLGSAKAVAQDGSGGEGFTAGESFLTELFAASEGEERDMVEDFDGTWFVLRVDTVAEERLHPLDEVRDEVTASWRKGALRKALAEKAETLVKRIDDGETIAAAAAELGVDVISDGPKTRGDAWEFVPADLVATLFTKPVGGAGLAPEGQNVIIGAVTEIAAGEDTPQNRALKDNLKLQMGQMAANDALSLYINARQLKIGATVNQQVMDSLTSQISGY